MSWINFEHHCTLCGYVGDELHRRSEVVDLLDCPDCGEHTWTRQLTAHVSTAKLSETRPAGVVSDKNGVRKDLKEMLALRKESRRLQREGRVAEARAVKQESRKVGGQNGV